MYWGNYISVGALFKAQLTEIKSIGYASFLFKIFTVRSMRSLIWECFLIMANTAASHVDVMKKAYELGKKLWVWKEQLKNSDYIKKRSLQSITPVRDFDIQYRRYWFYLLILVVTNRLYREFRFLHSYIGDVWFWQ